MERRFRLDWLAFGLALLLGIAYVYYAPPLKAVRITHPTPLNAGKIVYRDKGGNCFVIRAKEVSCDPDALKQAGLRLKKQTVQE